MPRDVILYASYSYFHNNMLPFSDIILIFSIFLVFNQEKNAGTFALTFRDIILRDVSSSCFPSLVPCL